MHYVRCMALGIAVLGSTLGCAGVKPYTITVPVPNHTLIPPSSSLSSYDSSGLAQQLGRTTLYCGAVKQAIAREIDERNRHTAGVHQWLLGIGSAAALSVTVYSGVVSTPRKEVLVPLGAISGSALVSALPSLGRDDRADALRVKLGSIQAKEATAMSALTLMEHGMSDLALLDLQFNRLSTRADSLTVFASKEKKYAEIQPIEDALRTALVALANECS